MEIKRVRAGTQHALATYLNRRLDEQKGSILAEWKSEGVYPYLGQPTSPTEEVEREIFDIVMLQYTATSRTALPLSAAS